MIVFLPQCSFLSEVSRALGIAQALDRAAELRPGCKLSDETRRRWLCEEDAMLRKLYFEKSGAAGYEKVGADAAWSGSTLPDSTELLVPVPLILLLPRLYGLTGIWITYPALDLLVFALACALLLREDRRLARREPVWEGVAPEAASGAKRPRSGSPLPQGRSCR